MIVKIGLATTAEAFLSIQAIDLQTDGVNETLGLFG